MLRPLAALFLATLLFAPAARAEIKAVTSIKPVHSLVAAVMAGVGTPGLIVDGAASPHTYALKPSQARDLADADLVFWVGDAMETFLEKPLSTIADDAVSVALIEAPGLVKHGRRAGGAFEMHDHGDEEGHDAAHAEDHDADHKDGDHDETAAKDDDHDHDGDHAETAAKHDDHDHDHDHDEGIDFHVWLDPVNAAAMVGRIRDALVEADPANADTYAANAEALTAKLTALTDEVAATLEPVRDRPFIVFHDAYQYFEKRFGISAAGSITVSPEVMPGARRVSEIRAKVKELGAVCVFSEPQFEPKLVATVTEGTPARSGVIDPIGARLDNGPELYVTLIRNMAASVRDCLAAAS